jgi:acid stress-induced BolA-like protein IbaG/YrbA
MNLLQRIASHGFVILADSLTADRVIRKQQRIIAGLDWLIAQNTTAGSQFEGKRDVKRTRPASASRSATIPDRTRPSHGGGGAVFPGAAGAPPRSPSVKLIVTDMMTAVGTPFIIVGVNSHCLTASMAA